MYTRVFTCHALHCILQYSKKLNMPVQIHGKFTVHAEGRLIARVESGSPYLAAVKIKVALCFGLSLSVSLEPLPEA